MTDSEALAAPAPVPAATAAAVRPGTPMLLAFLPYLLVAGIHLACIAGEFGEAARVSKYFLMPVLVLSVLLAFRLRPAARPAVPVLLVAGILASWAGDSFLTFDGGIMFVVGLGSFLLAHLAYLAVFALLGRASGAGRLPAWTLAYPIAVVGLAISLWSGLGSLVGPVLVYAGVLATMAATAARLGWVLALGGGLFFVSDSLLALGRFGDWYDFDLNGLAVMLTYTAAQGLIAIGVVRAAASAGSARPSAARDRRGSATAR